MTDEKNVITAGAVPVKVVASVELEAAIAEELKVEDPDLDKAKAILGLDETDPNESA